MITKMEDKKYMERKRFFVPEDEIYRAYDTFYTKRPGVKLFELEDESDEDEVIYNGRIY